MDYLSIKKMQNERIKKLLKNEPAHLKFILGKMKRTKGPHKLIIKGPKRTKTRSKTRSRVRSKVRTKGISKRIISKPGSKSKQSISKPASKTRSKSRSKSISKIGNIFKIFSKSRGSKGSKKRSRTITNPLITV